MSNHSVRLTDLELQTSRAVRVVLLVVSALNWTGSAPVCGVSTGLVCVKWSVVLSLD